MKIETIYSGGDLIVKFKNVNEYIDVLKKILEIDEKEEIPVSNLISPPEIITEEEEVKEVEVLQNNEKLQYLKSLKYNDRDMLISELQKMDIDEKDFFLNRHPDEIDYLYDFIKEFQSLFS